ncbi:programmed cell death 6-interacting protein isoform X1 [Felis catus]|uniref:programmed cell death 6-interacting protein isoform X1 n=1 Tax=Felis catus TaxID=9685 RepID=UPI000C2FDFF0|nr:programmed cell death 6-interacting protein isoform X1 [Felis catus]
MATFISVQLKKTSEVDLAKPLVKFIQQTYPSGGEEQAQYCRAAEELSKLRRAALGRPLDKHEGALETLLRYYDQICSIEPKFPFSENQICLTFTWKDAFDKGSLFGGSVKLALASLGYEKSCVLFNCAALASQIAAEQNLDNDEGLKVAAKHYQFASGAFLHIKETVLSALSREPTVDLSPDTVGTLSLIMLAQAQEVFFLKATRDKMKDAIIAKLANQAADYFGDAFKQCQYKDTLPKYFYFQEVFPVLAAKHCIMQANAEYHQSILAKQQKKFGEEIARLQHAAELIKTVASRYDEYVNVKDFSDKISRALSAAKKDNDFIYHDRVPDLKDLDPIGKATLVKSTPVSVPISQKFTDLFENMVPVSVQQSLAAYNQRKADLVNRSIAQMREATTLANGVLASLNLPAAIEDVSGDTVPQSILTKSTSVIEQGGIQTVDQLIKELPELLQRNREILDESLRLLDEEEATDNDLRAKFKERWQRTPSNDLYKPLRAEGTNFRTVLDKAVQADGQVKERYQSHRDTIALLCKPEPELNAAIPSANPARTMQGSEVVNVLKSLLTNLDEVKKEREGLENDLKSVNFDMTSKFLTALAQDGVINEEALSVTELDRIYGGLTTKVQESLRKQEELLKNIQVSHQEFSKMKQSNNEANLREEVLKNLATAYDNFVELVANLKEGTKFYNELTEILVRFQNKCSDIVFARKTERDELLNPPSPSPRPGLHRLCFQQIELLPLPLPLRLRLRLRLPRGRALLHRHRHPLLVQQRPLHRPRDPPTPPIQDIPGIATCPCPWAIILTHTVSIVCRTRQCITRAPDRLHTQGPRSLHTPSLSPRSSLTTHSSNMPAQKLDWFSSKGRKHQPCNKRTKLCALVTVTSSVLCRAERGVQFLSAAAS